MQLSSSPSFGNMALDRELPKFHRRITVRRLMVDWGARLGGGDVMGGVLPHSIPLHSADQFTSHQPDGGEVGGGGEVGMGGQPPLTRR